MPQGITACVTPWKGTIVRSGSSVMSEEYFKGSVATPSLMQCMNGAWQRCESDATNCSAHILPAKNLSMTGLQRYSEAIGAGCSGNGGRVVIAEPRTLLCANLIHQVTESTLCAYTQEDTAISLTCNYNNWGEVLTLH